jgi:hypothetical protein
MGADNDALRVVKPENASRIGRFEFMYPVVYMPAMLFVAGCTVICGSRNEIEQSLPIRVSILLQPH